MCELCSFSLSVSSSMYSMSYISYICTGILYICTICCGQICQIYNRCVVAIYTAPITSVSLDVNDFTRLIIHLLYYSKVLLDDTQLFYSDQVPVIVSIARQSQMLYIKLIKSAVKQLVGCISLPVVHSISGEPLVPGGHRQTNIAPSLMHSAFFPHPLVRQSPKSLSALPVRIN